MKGIFVIKSKYNKIMVDYLKGTLFVIIYISILYSFGAAILVNEESAPKRFVVGYVVFAILVAIVGIPVQLFEINWYIFMIYLIILIFFVLIYSIYRLKKYKVQLFYGNLVNFIKQYWFLIFIAIVLVALSTINFEWMWLNNCLDDGYYVNRMATLPYIKYPFSVTPGTGLINKTSFFDSYKINVFELEASVYIYILKIIPTLFVRGFLSLINYFLFACVTYCFFDKVNRLGDFQINNNTLQYFSIVIILFSLSYGYATSHNFHKLQDLWQNGTAMYYGSSIVRSMGLIILVTPLLGKEKIDIKDIIIYAMSSIMLMSKSSIALPLIVIVFISFIILNLLRKKYTLIRGLLLCFLMILISFILKNNQSMSNVYREQTLNNINSIIIGASLLVIIICCIIEHKKILLEINMYFVICFILTLLEPINNIFEKLSVYNFVACRFLTGLFIMVILFATFCLFLLLKRIFISISFPYFLKTIIVIFSTITLVSYGMLVQSGFSLKNLESRIYIFKENKYFAPQSVILLGDTLECLSKEKGEQLYALMPEGIGVEGYTYSLAISIRQFSPSTVSLSAFNRFPGNSEKKFADYNNDSQSIFYNYCTDQNYTNTNQFKKLIDNYSINCIITLGDFESVFKQFGFKLYSKLNYQNNYYIYYR